MLNHEGPRVVYWFGAGASANALPMVGLMPEALRVQAGQLRRLLGSNNTVSDALFTYEGELKELANLSIVYGTLDTYARSLYLQGDQEKLASLKLHLSMFFVLAPEALWAPPPGQHGVNEYQTSYDVDPRYMGWLAVLLGEGLKLNPRVKTISWNYDFQIEMALARYCNPGALDQVHDRYGIHPGIGREDVQAGDYFLTHLNGIAGQEMRQKGIHAWYKVHAGFFPGAITGIFKAYSDTGQMGMNMRGGFVDRMTFAWEQSPVAAHAIFLAEHALREADVLVVVGYSFPAFNRLIDNRLLKAFEKGPNRKNLVIQNPTATVEGFVNMFEVDMDQISVGVVNDCSQFHLPNELFK